jgi:medium-chain acyl-[acyl-carrier-protein] hydrolase
MGQMAAVVDVVASAMTCLLDKPFILFGHSMGGLICYELAQHLRANHGIAPAQLVVSGSPAPHLMQDRDQCYDLPDAQFLDRIRELNGTPSEILADAELMSLLLPVLRADFTIVDTYAYRPRLPLACPILAIGGTEDAEVDLGELLAWDQHTTNSFSHRLFSGGHFFINECREEIVSVLAELSASIARRVV